MNQELFKTPLHKLPNVADGTYLYPSETIFVLEQQLRELLESNALFIENAIDENAGFDPHATVQLENVVGRASEFVWIDNQLHFDVRWLPEFYETVVSQLPNPTEMLHIHMHMKARVGPDNAVWADGLTFVKLSVDKSTTEDKYYA